MENDIERNPYKLWKRGQLLYQNTGELSFETRPRSAGTFACTFLECVGDRHCKVINTSGRVAVEHVSLLSAFNI